MSRDCPKCRSTEIIKAGFAKSLQRYYCKECDFHFTLNTKGVSPEIKRLAIHLYIEGMGYRAISRITGISDVGIAKWINPIKNMLEPIRKREIRITELHKLEHFFITKELFNNFGWLLIGIEENRDICLFGSYTSGNCRIDSKMKN
jgi:transposase-like protein